MTKFRDFVKKYKDIEPKNREEEFQLAVIRAIEVFDRDIKKIKTKVGISEARGL